MLPLAPEATAMTTALPAAKQSTRSLAACRLKEKIRVVLNQNGKFICPNGNGRAQPLPAPPAKAAPVPPKIDNYAVVLADLKKRGASRPRKVETLKSTIRATVKNAKSSITESQLETLIKHLQVNGKIIVADTKVSYSL